MAKVVITNTSAGPNQQPTTFTCFRVVEWDAPSRSIVMQVNQADTDQQWSVIMLGANDRAQVIP